MGTLVGLFAAAMAVFGASPASGANQQVQVQDNVFVSAAVAVKPGESVTWNHPAGFEAHNVNFEDGGLRSPDPASPNSWTAFRTFTEAKAYPYYCQIHGTPGGGGMAGVVYVTATGTIPPAARFTVSPSIARPGQTVAFNASTSSDPEGPIATYEWDFTNDGSFETTGSMPTTAYLTTGMKTVRLKVTDGEGLSSVTTQTVAVTNEPTASFTVSPSPVQTGRTVTFNASASSDPDPGGSIANYEWDLDGDGTYETVTGTAPTTSRAYLTAGTRSVKLRVTDDLGASAETTRSLQINAAPPPARPPVLPVTPTQPTPILPAPQPVGCSIMKGAKRTACIQRTCRPLKGSRRATCIQRSCRYLARSKRPACIRKSCRYVTRSKRSACLRKSCRTLKGAKKRACIKKYTPRRS